MRNGFVPTLVALFLGLAACSSGPSSKVNSSLTPDVVAALQAGPVVLSSLHPQPRGRDEKLWEERGFDKLPSIDDYAVLGATELDAEGKKRILGALFRGIDANDGTAAACFNPRHALTVRAGATRYDLVICYECLSITIRKNGKHHGSTQTTSKPTRVFNAELKRAGVRLPKD